MWMLMCVLLVSCNNYTRFLPKEGRLQQQSKHKYFQKITDHLSTIYGIYFKKKVKAEPQLTIKMLVSK